MMRGVVKWLNHQKGFGMITPDLGGDVFVLTPLKDFLEGQRVVFDTRMHDSGKLTAVDIKVDTTIR
jgi:cold shock CspA family protein